MKVAYTIIIVPIAACRWSAIFGHTVPYAATIAADTIFLLSGEVISNCDQTKTYVFTGFVNAILYSTTRRIISISALLSYLTHADRKDKSPRPASLDDIQFSLPVISSGVVSFLSDTRSHGFTDHYEFWKPKGGDEMSARSYPSVADSKRALWVPNSEVTNHSIYGVPAEAHTVPNRGMLSPWRSNYTSHTMPIICHPVPEQQVIDVRTGHRNPSDSSFLAMEDTPPLRHKRLPDMGFPSLCEPAQDDSVTVHAELEQMRFAAPSPEMVVRKQPPSPPDPFRRQ